MNPVSALVLYAVLWTLSFFVALPIRLRTQGEVGEIVEGTHASAPAEHHLKKKAIIASISAAVLWVAIFVVIKSGWIGIDDLDWRK